MTLLLDRPIPQEEWLKAAGERNGASRAPARLRGVDGDQQEVPDAGPWEPAVQKIVTFQHLGDDWDGLGARAPSSEVLVSAIGLAYTLYQQGSTRQAASFPASTERSHLNGTIPTEPT